MTHPLRFPDPMTRSLGGKNGEKMDEMTRRYVWRLSNNLNDMRANAWQIAGAIGEDHSNQLRELMDAVDRLIIEIRKG